MKRYSLVLGLSILAGCASQPPAPVDRGTSAPPVPQTPLPPAAEPIPVPTESSSTLPVERLRGVYSKTAGWMLCGSQAATSIQAAEPVQAELSGFAPGEDAYFLDGWGRRTQQNAVELVNIERMHTEGPDCTEPLDGFVWVAHGQAPFWAFGITTQGIRFKPQGAQSRTYEYVTPQAEGSQVVYRGADYELVLEKQTCHSTATLARYAWQARLTTPEGSWQGCAWQGTQSEAATLN